MQTVAKTTHQSPRKKDANTIEVKFYKTKHRGKPQQTDLTSSPLHSVFEMFTPKILHNKLKLTKYPFKTYRKSNGIKNMR